MTHLSIREEQNINQCTLKRVHEAVSLDLTTGCTGFWPACLVSCESVDGPTWRMRAGVPGASWIDDDLGREMYPTISVSVLPDQRKITKTVGRGFHDCPWNTLKELSPASLLVFLPCPISTQTFSYLRVHCPGVTGMLKPVQRESFLRRISN